MLRKKSGTSAKGAEKGVEGRGYKLVILVTSLLIVCLLSGCGKIEEDSAPATVHNSEETASVQETTGEADPDETVEALSDNSEIVGKKAEENQDSGGWDKGTQGVEPEKVNQNTKSTDASTSSSEKTDYKRKEDNKEAANKNSVKESTQQSTTVPTDQNNQGKGKEEASPDGGNTQKDSGVTSSHTCSWDGGKETTGASCSQDGVITYTCSICGSTRTDKIQRTSHDYVTETAEATCASEGYTKTYCKNCGETTSQTTVPAKAHTMQQVWFGAPPDCTHNGYYDLVCSVCGWVDQHGGTSVPALRHEEDEGTVTPPIDCMHTGEIIFRCIRCGEQLRTDMTDFGACVDSDGDNRCDVCKDNIN